MVLAVVLAVVLGATVVLVFELADSFLQLCVILSDQGSCFCKQLPCLLFIWQVVIEVH